MLEGLQLLDVEEGLAALLSVEGRNVYTGDHDVLAELLVVSDEYFTVTLLVVEGLDHIWIVGGVVRAPAVTAVVVSGVVSARVTRILAADGPLVG